MFVRSSIAVVCIMAFAALASAEPKRAETKAAQACAGKGVILSDADYFNRCHLQVLAYTPYQWDPSHVRMAPVSLKNFKRK